MNRRAATILLVLLAALAAVLGFRWNQQFKRVQQIVVGTTPIQLGTLNRMTLTNPSSSPVQLELRCNVGPREVSPAAPGVKLVLQPQETSEFQVYPEHAQGQLPAILPNKACTALWHGPLGWDRRAWQVQWEYARQPHKQLP